MGIEYSLLKFAGDVTANGHASAIISWKYNSKGRNLYKAVINKVRGIKHKDILYMSSCFDTATQRFTVMFESEVDKVIITIDILQQRMSLITDNTNVQMLHDITNAILNSEYKKSVKHYIQKFIHKIKR